MHNYLIFAIASSSSSDMIRRITGLLIFSFLIFTSGMTQGIGWERYYGLQNRGETIEFVKTTYDNGILINLCIWNLQEFE
ncbi:MAG: hypothetical protein NT040_10680 [Bacteroidetes bacterium]|nr:hypothetical protein [Bacteroidota bacterium]